MMFYVAQCNYVLGIICNMNVFYRVRAINTQAVVEAVTRIIYTHIHAVFAVYRRLGRGQGMRCRRFSVFRGIYVYGGHAAHDILLYTWYIIHAAEEDGSGGPGVYAKSDKALGEWEKRPYNYVHAVTTHRGGGRRRSALVLYIIYFPSPPSPRTFKRQTQHGRTGVGVGGAGPENSPRKLSCTVSLPTGNRKTDNSFGNGKTVDDCRAPEKLLSVYLIDFRHHRRRY